MANEIQGKPEKLGQGELDVEAIARAVVEHIARALDRAGEPTDNETHANPAKLAPGEPDIEIIARAVVEHIVRALDKVSEPTKGEAQAGPEQLRPEKPDVTSIDAGTDGENAAFRKPLFDTHIIVDWSA